jgi:cell division protein FtsN
MRRVPIYLKCFAYSAFCLVLLHPGYSALCQSKDTGKADVGLQKQKFQAPQFANVRSSLKGKYAVQIGAYKMPDKADNTAELARLRFQQIVYSYLDKNDNLYKVYIGDFTNKEEARNFRDEMMRKYPSDYKDAWASEHPKN